MADSRDEAFAKLNATREYVFLVADEFARGVKEGWLKPKEVADHKNLWNSYANTVEKPFVEFYNKTQESGISYVNAGDVQATCSTYVNNARGYHDKLKAIAKAAGKDVLNPVAPEDKPPPSPLQPIAQGLSDVGKGLVVAGIGVIVLVIATRK